MNLDQSALAEAMPIVLETDLRDDADRHIARVTQTQAILTG